MAKLKAGAASREIVADDTMIIAGGILPNKALGQEGMLRACALVLQADIRLAIIMCDVLFFSRDFLDRVGGKIEAQYGIPFENIMFTTSHTHHAPPTFKVHGYDLDEVFLERVEESILAAVKAAVERLEGSDEVELCFCLGSEDTVGVNSRLLMKDGTIAWYGYDMDETIRPTGPMDPELPVLAFRRPDGGYEGIIFNHSCHNIGSYNTNVRSPGFYGLAAHELESKLGGTVFYIPGAFSSTHNLGVPNNEAVFRIRTAVEQSIPKFRTGLMGPLKSVKVEFEYKVREFDEEAEDKAVSYWCNKWNKDAGAIIDVFRKMRDDLAKHQGETRQTWLQALLLGDIAFVGIPAELFTVLGMEIKRRSPFRYTYVVGVANDFIGYVADRQAYDLGGYQVWTGYHCFAAPGTGETIVEESLNLLSELHHSINKVH